MVDVLLDGTAGRRHLGTMSDVPDQSRPNPVAGGHLDPDGRSGQAAAPLNETAVPLNEASAALNTAPLDSSGRPLNPAAQRALAEAAARRAAIDARAAEIASRPESDGRGGLEPVRYEDWEIKGRAVDF